MNLPVPTLFDDSGSRGLPALLQRPDERGAIARLTYANAEETENGGGPRWKLTGSPSVILLAKRLFSGALSRKNDSVTWPAVPAMFEDLLMLQHRYPIEIGVSAREVWNDQYEEIVLGYEARLGIERESGQPTGGGNFRGTLMPFQEIGVRFLIGSRKSLLADEMGLGKTPQALAFLDRIDDWPAVIVAQAHVQRHWERKIEEFLDCVPSGAPLAQKGRLTYSVLRGTKPSASTPKADIYLVHYLVLRSWDGWLKARGVRTVIFDEAQELRHPGTAKYAACRLLARSAANVVGLSGTPIYNRGLEIYNVLNTLNRGCLGTKKEFQESWCSWGSPEIVEDPGMLGQYLTDRRLILRRRKEDVLTDLPPKRRVTEPIDADNETFANLVKEARTLAKSAMTIRDPFDRARMEAEAISGARMATGVAKAPAIVLFLRGLLEAEEPTLVFLHHHAVIDTVLDALDEFNPACITGRESLAQKEKSQQRFVAGDTNLCIIGLRAATGLDGLQARARVVVFGELDWSPAVHRQAEDRAHRHGQTDSVICYYLTTDIGTDPFVMQTLNVKESQYLGLMQDRVETDEDRQTAETVAKEHMEGVLRMLRGEA